MIDCRTLLCSGRGARVSVCISDASGPAPLTIDVMLGSILDAIGESLFEAVFYLVGRIAIPVVSFGRWHCLPLLSRVSKDETAWGGLIHRTRTRVYFTSGGTAAIGGMVCLLVALLLLVAWYLHHQ